MINSIEISAGKLQETLKLFQFQQSWMDCWIVAADSVVCCCCAGKYTQFALPLDAHFKHSMALSLGLSVNCFALAAHFQLAFSLSSFYLTIHLLHSPAQIETDREPFTAFRTFSLNLNFSMQMPCTREVATAETTTHPTRHPKFNCFSLNISILFSVIFRIPAFVCAKLLLQFSLCTFAHFAALAVQCAVVYLIFVFPAGSILR